MTTPARTVRSSCYGSAWCARTACRSRAASRPRCSVWLASCAAGHEARVLGPCDGPPPASFVTPLGDSLPTAANGSIAPLAPDPAAALRTIRALNDEQFDVLHLHEPLVPGPSLTTLNGAPGTDRRHVPRRRSLDELPDVPPASERWSSIGSTTVSWCRRRPGSSCSSTSAASTRSCSTASRRPRSARRAVPAHGPTIFSSAATRSARASPSCSRRCRDSPADVRSGSRATARRRRASSRVRQRPARRVARAASPTRQDRPPARRLGVLRAVAPRRVVRRRAGRGDGGRHRGRRERPPRVPQRRDRRGRRGARPARRSRCAGGRARRGARRRGLRSACRGRRGAGRRASRCRNSPANTCAASYDRRCFASVTRPDR